MSNPPNPILQILYGILLLLGCHILAVTLIFLLGVLVAVLGGGYAIFAVWIYGFMGFFLVQLLYVIPLILWLKRRGRIGMMQGVIGMAVVTALLNGACYLVAIAPTIGR
jgi:hypothetical protein